MSDPFPDEPSSFRAGGVLFGKFRIERVIAQGGLGVIVAATHVQLEQRVAIKYLKPEALSQKAVVDRFLREARLASQIKSDHVVRVHDVGVVDDGGPYIIMEYLEGIDLGRVLMEKGPLLIRTAVDYVLQACEALAEAHAMGIVHRDLKPGNMFLAKRAAGSSIVKLIDFGISKTIPGRSPSGTWENPTTGKEVFGTPVYMSPEQLRAAADVDPRSDVWALGVVLHELLCGTMPFDGENVPQLCSSILSDPPVPLTRVRTAAPPELEAVILKCLEKDRTRRYRNVAELAQELAPFGPESAAERVEHIRRVIQEGGASVRPPAPSRASFDLLAMANGSSPPVTVELPRSRKKLVLATAASLATALALGLLLVVSGRQGDAAHAVSSAASAASVPSPVPTASVSTAPSASGSSEPEAMPLASAPPSSVTATPPVRPPPRRVGSPPASTPTPRRNQEFGERQ
ncbi:MAG TPA: serine/threonine-protein kinase [Polyangiaceae bacterium]